MSDLRHEEEEEEEMGQLMPKKGKINKNKLKKEKVNREKEKEKQGRGRRRNVSNGTNSRIEVGDRSEPISRRNVTKELRKERDDKKEEYEE